MQDTGQECAMRMMQPLKEYAIVQERVATITRMINSDSVNTFADLKRVLQFQLEEIDKVKGR